MRFKLTIIAIFCLLFAGLLGCDKLNPKKAEPAKQAASHQAAVKGALIAKVNNMSVTLEELNQEVEAYNAMVTADKPEMKITTREQKVDYLKNEMVRRLLLYQQAQAKGLERNEEVIKAIEKTKMELLVVELVKEEAQSAEVTSKEIEDYYNAYKEQLKEPEERQVREIVVPTEQEAKDILVQLLQGADFATLAKERSKAATAKNGGDLGVIQKGKKSEQFDNVAFADNLEVGGISSIFKGPDGYAVVKMEAKRGGKQRSLSEMWEDIKRGLTFLKQRQKIDDLIAQLSRDAKLEFYEGEIK
jgi:peptidyl-prolyl cis-trans isomerase C